MDNFQIKVVSEGRPHFDMALGMCFDKYKMATHYIITKNGENKAYSLTFYWIELDKAEALPYPMGFKAASDFAWHWLEHGADYGSEPDHDGDNHKGFLITNGDNWGQINGAYQSICQIQPCWAMYGK
jgi:hypothetical protein